MNDALLHGLPVIAVIAVIALIYRRTGKRPEPYRLSQPWTHEPILWAAVDEPIPAPHGGHHSLQHGTAESTFSVGGGASGRW